MTGLADGRGQPPGESRVPHHIAIIMDGNGRWARRQGMPRIQGHRAGVEALRDVVEAAAEWGIRYLTLFAFSTENWKRPRQEVDALMTLLVNYIDREVAYLVERGVRVRVIGDVSGLPPHARRALERCCGDSAGGDGLTVTLALNYGARNDIARAAGELARDAVRGQVDLDAVDAATFAPYLATADLPEPDLLIRPSGEMRVSNFLLWEIAYTELYFSPVLWPDFRREHLMAAITDYAGRDRRYGGLGPGGVEA